MHSNPGCWDDDGAYMCCTLLGEPLYFLIKHLNPVYSGKDLSILIFGLEIIDPCPICIRETKTHSCHTANGNYASEFNGEILKEHNQWLRPGGVLVKATKCPTTDSLQYHSAALTIQNG